MARARTYTTEALVLRRSDFGEADRLLTLLTRESGKVRAIAKGARRPTSRHSGNLELFGHTRLLLARGRELDIVSQSELIQPFRSVRENLGAASHAYYLAEVTDGFLEPGEGGSGPFGLLVSAYQALDQGAEPRLLAAHFLMLLLDSLGYRPELFTCLSCGTELRPESNYLSLLHGGAMCPDCGRREPASHAINVDTLKVMRYLQKSRQPGGLSLKLPSGLVEQVARQVRGFAEHHLDRRLRSPEFIARLRDFDAAPTALAGAEKPTR